MLSLMRRRLERAFLSLFSWLLSKVKDEERLIRESVTKEKRRERERRKSANGGMNQGERVETRARSEN